MDNCPIREEHLEKPPIRIEGGKNIVASRPFKPIKLHVIEWTPVATPPKEVTRYFVTIELGGELFVGILEWAYWDGDEYAWCEGASKFRGMGNVIAWVPLPEPYRETV